MVRLQPRTLYGRGLNIAAQLSPTRQHFPTFAPIQTMRGAAIKQLGCGYLQSYYLLQEGEFVKVGYYMDSLTSIRIFNMHRLMPKAIPFIQKMTFLGSLLSFRGGDQHPAIFNRDVSSFERIEPGGCRVFGFDAEGRTYAMGENYFGQLGTHNILSQESQFTQINPPAGQPAIESIGCGFQHSLFVTRDGVYGCGKASEYQIQPLKYYNTKHITDHIQVPEAILNGQKVKKAAGGLKFSLIWAHPNQLYAVGQNNFGQCGQNHHLHPEIPTLTLVPLDLEEGEQIVDIQCGFCHSLILTNRRVYFFGSTEQGQNPFNSFHENICAPTPLPIANPVRIFANFDRSGVISDEGELHLWGGRDYQYCGGENGRLEVIEGVGPWSLVGLGFAHTLLYP